MRFAASHMLVWMLVAVPLTALLLWWARRRQHRKLQAYWGASRGAQLSGMMLPQRRWRFWALLGSVIFLFIAAARPQWGFTWQRLPALGKDVFVVVDVSNSMLAQDIRPSRLAQAKREIFDLLAAEPPARIGLVVFAGAAFLYCPLTSDHEALRMFVEDLDPSMMSRQGTALGQAIAVAAERLAIAAPEESAGKAIVVITDGEDQEVQAEDAVHAATKQGIDFAFIGIGTTEGAPIPEVGGGFKKDEEGRVVVSRLGEATLQKLADASNGVYVRADVTDADLARVLPLFQGGDPVDGAERDGERRQIWHEQYVWFVLLAFLLLFLESLSKISGWKIDFQKTKKNRQQMWAFLIIWLVSIQFSTITYANEDARRRAAHAAFERGEFAEAAGKFLELEVDKPAHEPHIYNRAVSQFHAQQFDDARAGFARAAQSADQALAARSYFNLGNTEVARHDLNAAIAAYEKALQITPQDEAAQENLAWAKEQLKRQQQQEAPSDSGPADKNPQTTPDNQMSSQTPSSHSDQTSTSSPSQTTSSDAATASAPETQKRPDSQKTDEPMAADSRQSQPSGAGHDESHTESAPATPDHSQTRAAPANAAGVSLDQEQAKRTLRRAKDAKHRRVQPASTAKQANSDEAVDESRRDW